MTVYCTTAAQLASAIHSGDSDIVLNASINFGGAKKNQQATDYQSSDYYIGRNLTIRAGAGYTPYFQSDRTYGMAFYVGAGLTRVTFDRIAIADYANSGIKAASPITFKNGSIINIRTPGSDLVPTLDKPDRQGICLDKAHGSIVSNSAISYCGNVGIKVYQANNVVIEKCTIGNNNSMGFPPGSTVTDASGIKFITSSGAMVKQNTFTGDQYKAASLWFDVHTDNFNVIGNNFTGLPGNECYGLHVELSDTGNVMGNLIKGYNLGIGHDMSSYVNYINNTLIGNNYGLKIYESGARAGEPRDSSNGNKWINNVVQDRMVMMFEYCGSAAHNPDSLLQMASIKHNAYASAAVEAALIDRYGVKYKYDLNPSGYPSQTQPRGLEVNSLFKTDGSGFVGNADKTLDAFRQAGQSVGATYANLYNTHAGRGVTLNASAPNFVGYA